MYCCELTHCSTTADHYPTPIPSRPLPWLLSAEMDLSRDQLAGPRRYLVRGHQANRRTAMNDLASEMETKSNRVLALFVPRS